MAIYNGGLSVKNVSVSTTGTGNAITSLTADGNVITANSGNSFVTKRDNGCSYNNLASFYTLGTKYNYLRITIPPENSTWTMCTLEISLRQNYDQGYFGKILFHGNWSSSSEWNKLYSCVYGRLSKDVKLYTSDKKYIYIAGCDSWCTCSVDKMLIGDNATTHDLSAVKIEGVNSLPATYQTVNMVYDINSSNISSQSVLNATNATNDSAGDKISDTYLKLSGGTLTGDTTFKRYLKINAWDGYGTGSADFWYNGNDKSVDIQNASNLKLSGVKVSKEDHTHNYAGSSSAGGPATDFVTSVGSDDADRYVYFAYNDTTYNNSNPNSVTKGRAVVDSEFKYNPYTNTLTAGTFKGALSGNSTSSSSLINIGQLDTQEKIDNFLEGNKLKYATFKTAEQNNVGFGSNDGMIISIPWSSNTYGAQIAFDDISSATVKVRAKADSWSNWKKLWMEGDSITAPVITATDGFNGNLNGNASSSNSCSGNSATATLASQSNQIKTTAATNSRAYYLSFTDAAATYNNLYTNSNATYNPGEQTLKAPRVEGAVCNDLADSIPVDDDCNLEHGYCYCFDGKKYYKSSKYLDNGIIGIHSDTFGFRMGTEEGKKKMDVAVSGFVLAYVDKEYPVGTPLTCTKDGYLTEIELEDKMKYPEKIVATYWKNEPAKEWGLDNKKVKVNGRKWVKIK